MTDSRAGGEKSSNWRDAIVRELKGVGLVTLYFLVCFGIVLTLKKLFLADYHIETYALSTAVVGAIVAAKVVVTLDHTRAGTRFDASRSLVTAVSYKTLVYGAAGFAVLFAEHLFHAWRAHGLESGLADVWAERDRNVILAKVICVALSFAGYHLYTGIDRRLGEGTLRRVLSSRAPSGGHGDQPLDGASTVDSASTSTRKETEDGRRTEAQHPRHPGR